MYACMYQELLEKWEREWERAPWSLRLGSPTVSWKQELSCGLRCELSEEGALRTGEPVSIPPRAESELSHPAHAVRQDKETVPTSFPLRLAQALCDWIKPREGLSPLLRLLTQTSIWTHHPRHPGVWAHCCLARWVHRVHTHTWGRGDRTTHICDQVILNANTDTTAVHCFPLSPVIRLILWTSEFWKSTQMSYHAIDGTLQKHFEIFTQSVN